MKYLALAAVAALVGQALPSVAAPITPIASVSCSGSAVAVSSCALAADGLFPANGTPWRQDAGATPMTAYWQPDVGSSAVGSIVYTLTGVQSLTGFTVSLDNNDTYLLQTSLDNGSWTDLATITAPMGNVVNGMEMFTRTFAATSASYVKILQVSGDRAYAVGELSLVTAVPEPSSIALLAAGLGLVGFVAARRRRVDR